jgi:excisionase family DNA binding protein
MTQETRITAARGLMPQNVRSVLVDHAASMLGVSRRTVYYRIRDGRLRTIRTRSGSRRVLLESVARLMREQTNNAP